MDTVNDFLQRLGFSEYEARAYSTLVRRSPLTGYEVAKISGVPRPNAYSALERLESRGAVVRVETPTATQYAPVPPAELLGRIERDHRMDVASARRALATISGSGSGEPEGVWGLSGQAATLEHARAIIHAARRHLLAVVQPPEAAALAPGLAAAEARSVAITTLCLDVCEHRCNGCRGMLYRYRAEPLGDVRWLVVVADETTLLLGETQPTGGTLGFRTRQPLLVRLASSYVRRSIALATIVTDLGDTLDAALSPESREALEALGSGGGFLKELRSLLERGVA